jgi:hypothetical protein
MRSRVLILIYLITGGSSFWVPNIIYHVMKTDELSKQDIGILTILLPSGLITFYGILLWLKGRQSEGPSVAIFMLFGVWLLGPISMLIGATFSGGGFTELGANAWIIIMLGIIPIYTFIMSAYDGSVLGLLLASSLMVSAHLMYERKNHWVISPSIKRFVRQFKRE